MRKKHETLIRGVIYDNPNILEEKAFETTDMLVMATERGSNFYDSNKHMFDLPNELPTKEQFVTSVVIGLMCNPLPGVENMLIPADLVDDRLYKDLKKIDIGEQVVDMYKQLCVENYLENEEQDENVNEERFSFGIIDPSTGEKVVLESDLSREELIEKIQGLNNLTGTDLAKIINDIKAA